MGPKTVVGAARAWREHVIEKRHWGKRNSERYCEVRYEDLLDNPEREIGRICRFLGVNFRPEMLDFGEQDMARAIANSNTHRLLGQTLNSFNQRKWLHSMPQAAIAKFEYIAGDQLEAFRYSRSATSASGLRKLVFAGIDVIERLQECFSYKELRLWLKAILPLVILVCGVLSLRPEKLLNSRFWLSAERIPIRKRRVIH